MTPAGKPRHSRIPPSGMARIIKCAASVALSDGYEEESSEYADEGTAAHTLASDCLESEQDAWEHAGRIIKAEDSGREFEVDTEMVLGTQEYLDYCRSRLDLGHKDFWIEERVYAPQYHDDAYGTLDFGVLLLRQKNEETLEIVDFKYGKGIVVEPEWNPQLLTYAAYLIENIPNWDLYDIKRIRLTVVQPRIEHERGTIRSWDTTPEQLGEWVDIVLRPTLKRVDNPLEEPTPGRHCRYCPALKTGRCPVGKAWFDDLIAAEKALKSPSDFTTMSDEALALLVEKFPVVEKWIGGAKDELLSRQMRGRKMPGFKLVHQRPVRIWRDRVVVGQDEEGNDIIKPIEEALTDAFGDDAFVKKQVSPPQAEKLKGGKKLVTRWAFKPETGLTTAPAGDSREEVVIKTADPNETFGSYIQE